MKREERGITMNRKEKILANFSFRKEGNQWVATNRHFGITEPTTISGEDREKVRYKAKCQWGHFNFESEAEAFDFIFRPESIFKR